jgi:DNA-binding transcriptional LysR family regulator
LPSWGRSTKHFAGLHSDRLERWSLPLIRSWRFMCCACTSDFHALYPEIRIDIRVIQRLTDADAQTADVFVLHGWPEGNDLVHRQLGHTRALVVGAPEYWSLHGIPKHPQELVNHTCLLMRNPAGILIDLWEFARGAEKVSVNVNGWLCSTGREVVLEGVLAGEALLGSTT